MKSRSQITRLASLAGSRLAALCLALVCLAACDTRGSAGSVAPGGRGSDSELEPVGEFEGESIDELKLRLERLSDEQQIQLNAGNQDPAKCEELCELSQAICEVKTKMCELADERPGDAEYQDLCRMAKQRCQRASEGCVRCVQHHRRSSTAEGATSESASCEGDAGSTEATEP